MADIRHIFRWDLDKTYLRTDFDSVRDLIRTALLRPEERVNVPGADSLLRELTREGDVRLTFISGSPESMRARLEAKFALDGIEPDAFMLKPQLKNILAGRFRALRGQVGYKLATLVKIRGDDPPVPETCFGDDAEMDAFIYSLYGDMLARQIEPEALDQILARADVYPDTAHEIVAAAAALREHPGPTPPGVQRIFIHLDRRTAPGRFWVFGPRVVPITNYFQAALVLYADGVLPAAGCARVAAGMMSGHGYGLMDLANSFQDLARRGHLGRGDIDRLHGALLEGGSPGADVLPPGFIDRLLTRALALSPRTEGRRGRDWDGPVDYLAILDSDRAIRESVQGEAAGRRGLFS